MTDEPGAGRSMPRSVSFDQAAGFYDRTRGLPEETVRAQTALLAAELAEAGRCLEIGVGTGRVALPLAETGLQVIGVDLSEPMLRRLRDKAADVVPVAVADATRLPFRDGTFGGVVACHVLHLVEAWRGVVMEAVRVLRPGGRLLVCQGGFGQDCGAAELRARLQRAAGGRAGRIGLRTMDELDAYARDAGLAVRVLPAVPNGRTQSAAEFLERLAENCYSWTWDLDEVTRRAAVGEVRAWAEGEWGDLAATTLASPPLVWHAYQVPPPA